jgi:hypothetical protein
MYNKKKNGKRKINVKEKYKAEKFQKKKKKK